MGKLPQIPYMTGKKRIKHSNPQVMAFGGLNFTNNVRDGEYADTENITTSGFPFMQTSGESIVPWDIYGTPNNLFIWDGVIYYTYVDDGTTYLRSRSFGAGVNKYYGEVLPGLKQMAVINTKVVIFPDKKYIDTESQTIHSLIKENRTYSSYTITHNSITATGIGSYFSDGDTVDVTGTGIEGMHIVVQSKEANKLNFVDNAISLDDNSGSVTIKSSVPDLDFICSSNNRIWGVNNEDRTVYASALGDPTDFYSYANDSGAWTVAIGSEGDFTGICNFSGAVLVWKEHMLHKILGSYPSEYYMVEYPINGVQSGSDRSLVVINNVLYYKGVHAVYQYGGNRPVSISANLGEEIYTGGIATGNANTYYIYMEDSAGNPGLYAYDISHGLWVKKNSKKVVSSAMSQLTAYVVYEDDNDVIYTISENDRADHDVSWFAELVEVTENTFGRKGYTKLNLRLDLGVWSSFKIYAKEDRRDYREIYSLDNLKKLYYLPETVVTGDGTYSESVDVLPKVGDPIVFYQKNIFGDPDLEQIDELVWESETMSSGVVRLFAYVLTGPIDESIEAYCYPEVDPTDPRYMKVYVSYEDVTGETISVWKPEAVVDPVTQIVPIRLGRCDRWQLKFEGTGDVTIRGIEKDYVEGSEK